MSQRIGVESAPGTHYLALPSLLQVYAHSMLNEPGEGFESAPGIHYLAQHLRSLANNSSFTLLSLNAVAVPAGLVIYSVYSQQVSHLSS